MQVQVSGKGVDVGEALRLHVEKRLAEGISKYSDRVNQVQAVISRESHLFRVDLSANLGTHSGIVVKGRDAAGDVYAAFDAAADKVEKQLRRYKRKLTNHHKDDASLKLVKATKYVLQSHNEEEVTTDDHAPLIVAEKATDIGTYSVSEAVMQMDLQDLPALLFFNSKTSCLNVVYKRADGNISWVDSEVAPASKTSEARSTAA